MSPYLSKNYRFKKKPRLQSLREAGLFVGFSMLAIMLTLFVLGWIAYAFEAQAASGINQQLNYQGKMTDSSGLTVSDASWNFKFEPEATTEEIVVEDGDTVQTSSL
ncbi:MAG: hypothetical protein CMI53_05410 [Parcubacteria group bacterium]|jgi:hypothetical protein|nr:hypothetical protein [Parcubacteria group bacterium]|tara:strand:+ start:451 stop:768 length:318 start_codon:yes stop_codon:yes gene_type:complete